MKKFFNWFLNSGYEIKDKTQEHAHKTPKEEIIEKEIVG